MNYAGKFDANLSADALGLHLQGHGKVETITHHATHAPADAIIVADPHLLFTGDFKRSGVDLILSADDHELLLRDYFKTDKRAPLSSPDGAHLTGDVVTALTGYTQFAQAGGTSVGKVIGHVSKLAGTATAVRNGVSIILNNGDNVEKGDVVQSGSDSTLGITFIDGTVFGLSSNARMVLNEMVYDPNGSNNSSLLSLVAGTITFVAGETAKHGDMKVDTPVATMGIRGTAVLVEVDFEIPIALPSPAPPPSPSAKFQVLVEPDGTTGSYILFDKNTLTPIATVNQAGQQINISQGQVTITNAPLPPDIQKLITDVFSLKFTSNDNNPKMFDHFTDTLIPQSLQPIMLANGSTAIPLIVNVSTAEKSTSSGSGGPLSSLDHIPGPPAVVALGGSLVERTGLTHNSAIDTLSNKVSFADINAGDLPTVSVKFGSFSYLNAANEDVTATLNAQQLADIAALELKLGVVQDLGNKNTGSATWTYSIADSAFDFLAADEKLTLTYIARVDNNFALNNEFTEKPFTITITGTDDAPVIAATSAVLADHPGTLDHAGGTITFTDVDLTDRPVVSTAFSSFSYRDSHGNDITSTLTVGQQAAIAAVEASLSLTPSPSNANDGSIAWSYEVADGNLGFLADGETLTLTYLASIDDGHGGTANTPITVTIVGGNLPHLVTELAGHTGDTIDQDTVSGTVAFTGVGISSVNTSLVSAIWSGGSSLPDGLVSALGSSFIASGTSSVDFTFSAADNNFDFLAEGETLTIIYDVSVVDSHGVSSIRPVTFIVTGTNDAPTIVAGSTSATGAVTELLNTSQPNPTGSTAFDTATGLVTFTDADLSDTHVVTVTGVTTSGTTSGLPTDPATVLGWFSLGTVAESTNSATGSDGWIFSAQDKSFDYLAEGQSVTLSYTVQVDDGHGGVVTQPVAITITGTNDTPAIATTSGAFAELSGTNNVSIDHASGSISFADVDLTDRPSVSAHYASFAYENAQHVDITDTLTGQQLAAVAAVEASLTLTPSSSNSNNGSVAWSYDVPDNKFDFLAAGDTLMLTYTATVDDTHGGIISKPITIAVTGTNDTPTILAETNAPTQAVVVLSPVTPTILAHGLNTNSLGLDTETFDSLSAGSASNNGAGHGSFDSVALQATFSASGNAGVVIGSSGVSAAPFIGPLPGAQDATNYLSIGAGGTETITFDDEKNAFGLYWGSLDSFNTIKFYDDATLVASYTGADISPLLPTGNQSMFSASGYVEFSNLANFNKVVLGTGDSNAFEIDNISAGSVADSHVELSAPISGSLTVSDADIGDTLTASVVGNAHLEYNGSTTLPNNADVSALIAANAITFDTVKSDGGVEVLHWTYDPTNPDLDFLKSGDTLTITFTAQVNDGHVSVGNQPLTITLTGTETPKTSDFEVVNGTSGNDMFVNVGGNTTIFGAGGQDTFVFNAGFGSATIGDFDVNKDTIGIDHTLVADITALLASAQAINSGHDTILTDAFHDTITLSGVTVAQIQAHQAAFHLV